MMTDPQPSSRGMARTTLTQAKTRVADAGSRDARRPHALATTRRASRHKKSGVTGEFHEEEGGEMRKKEMDACKQGCQSWTMSRVSQSTAPNGVSHARS